MEPGQTPQTPQPVSSLPTHEDSNLPEPAPRPGDEIPYRGLRWIFLGQQGLRAGWSAATFIVLTLLIMLLSGSLLEKILKARHHKPDHYSPGLMILQETIFFFALLISAAVVARIEHRRVLDYNLTGPRRLTHFFGGLAFGFAALAALVGAMNLGGWLKFGPATLSGTQILWFGILWGAGFLLVGLCEEGSFRCFLQFTFTRGMNFWWALGLVFLLSLIGLLNPKDHGAIGVDILALLGLTPCLFLHLKKLEGSGFWFAAWATSTLFGFIHTGNNGESWIGIFSAGFIGFVFCVSIYLTGSAWWAIGCHAAWDWAETFFFGTANSGLPSQGHLLSTTPAGNPLWSGGTDGPEGSLLVIPALLLLLALLYLFARLRRQTTPAAP